jgi:GT2 family glycosyltransferase
MQKNIIVVIPNWNGARDLPAAVDSVLAQTYKNLTLVVVDNGSTDDSKAIIEAYKQKDKRVVSIYRDKNYGYTGGVNPGFEYAIEHQATYVAPFNNDAQADKHWLKHLADFLDKHPTYGIAACSLLHADGKHIDSTADQYTIWGIPFPRGRDEPADNRYNNDRDIFGASGGASLYRVKTLQQVGLLDQDFFAYYEDIDLSFRAQLAGWKVAFVPESIVYHAIGQTSARLGKRQGSSGSKANPFTTKQYMKNLPFIIVKDVPMGLLWRVLPRFWLAYTVFFLRAFTDHRGSAALKGAGLFWLHLPKKLLQRRRIQKNKQVSNDYLWSIFIHDLPPNAHKLRKLRTAWWRIAGRRIKPAA